MSAYNRLDLEFSYIIMFDELATAATQHGTKHAFAFTEPWILALLVLDVDIESITLQEKFQVAIVLQSRMCGSFVQHSLQRSASRLHKISIKTSDSLLLWRRRNDDAGVVVV